MLQYARKSETEFSPAVRMAMGTSIIVTLLEDAHDLKVFVVSY